MTDVAHDTAVQDLRCPPEQVHTTQQDASSLASPSHYLATGCGRSVKYVCYPIGKASFKCFPDQPAVPQPIDGGTP